MKKIKFYLTLLFVSFLSLTFFFKQCEAQVSTYWTKASSTMSVPRASMASAVAGEKIYVIGGASPYDDLSILEEYDIAEDSWKILPSMPTSRWGGHGSVNRR